MLRDGRVVLVVTHVFEAAYKRTCEAPHTFIFGTRGVGTSHLLLHLALAHMREFELDNSCPRVLYLPNAIRLADPETLLCFFGSFMDMDQLRRRVCADMRDFRRTALKPYSTSSG